MSHYISTFLLEPVVRQARRFSRPAQEASPPLGPQSSAAGVERKNDGTEELTLSHCIDDERPRGREDDTLRGREENGYRGVLAEAAMLTPISQDDGLENEVRDLPTNAGLNTSPSQPSAMPSAQSRGNTERAIEDATSSNPLVEIQDRLSSNNTSFSNSIHETGQGVTRSRGNTGQSGALPADDGMGVLRKRIIEIQGLDTSNREKSRLIHDLMTEQYSSSQLSLISTNSAHPYSPASMTSNERPYTPSSADQSVVDTMRGTSPPTSPQSPAVDTTYNYHVSPEDLVPTYYSKPAPAVPKGDSSITRSRNSSIGQEQGERHLGCKHYRRNVKLQCSTCKRWYTCRFCHDDVEDHSLIRRETKIMLCMLCGCAQPASEECRDCGERGAWYYCDVCKLWDDDPARSIYHCNDCGICRVGQGLGKDFYHCKVSPSYSSCSDMRLKPGLDVLCLLVDIDSRHPSMHRAIH